MRGVCFGEHFLIVNTQSFDFSASSSHLPSPPPQLKKLPNQQRFFQAENETLFQDGFLIHPLLQLRKYSLCVFRVLYSGVLNSSPGGFQFNIIFLEDYFLSLNASQNCTLCMESCMDYHQIEVFEDFYFAIFYQPQGWSRDGYYSTYYSTYSTSTDF